MVLSFRVTALNISVRHYLGKAEIVEATAKKSSPIGFRPITTNFRPIITAKIDQECQFGVCQIRTNVTRVGNEYSKSFLSF